MTKNAAKTPIKYAPLFLGSNGNDIWLNLLEKVYAYGFGLYTSILSGVAHEVLYSFLDGEYRVYKLSKEKKDGI